LWQRGRACDPALLLLLQEGDGARQGCHLALERGDVAPMLGREPPGLLGLAPHFREGHALPPLTRYCWTLPLDARAELAERWGYALEFGGYVSGRRLRAPCSYLPSASSSVSTMVPKTLVPLAMRSLLLGA
jgi:hypothetical protein